MHACMHASSSSWELPFPPVLIDILSDLPLPIARHALGGAGRGGVEGEGGEGGRGKGEGGVSVEQDRTG